MLELTIKTSDEELDTAAKPPAISCWLLPDWYVLDAGLCARGLPYEWSTDVEVTGLLLCACRLEITPDWDGRLLVKTGVEGLNRCKCGAGARISLPVWRAPVEGVMELTWGGLVGVPDKNAVGLTTGEGGFCALTTAGEAV